MGWLRPRRKSPSRTRKPAALAVLIWFCETPFGFRIFESSVFCVGSCQRSFLSCRSPNVVTQMSLVILETPGAFQLCRSQL